MALWPPPSLGPVAEVAGGQLELPSDGQHGWRVGHLRLGEVPAGFQGLSSGW
jgi:hypothetical protein